MTLKTRVEGLEKTTDILKKTVDVHDKRLDYLEDSWRELSNKTIKELKNINSKLGNNWINKISYFLSGGFILLVGIILIYS